ncbi:tyrosine-type recombinase/integrase [Ornithinimicrobium cerasi]|uniref:tyrosine-type recombinase/integrase n=1 Tax=Ornithinimicrobium cerasi TaxID=2248773 RepID=UPI000F001201|nr:site-specific integrase [Ornithinimicrobium cerasi]
MASVHPRGKTWVVRYRTPQGTNAQKTFKGYREAQAFKAEVETQTNKGTLIDPTYRRLTYADWHETWMTQRPDLRESTRARVEGIARVHLLPTFGHLPVQRITQQDVQTWVTKQQVAPATVRRNYGELSNSFTAAVAAGIITVSPCRGIRLPKVPRAGMAILDHEEIEALAACILPRYRALVYLLAYGGLRIGEALDLTPADVDLKKGTVRVDSTLTMGADGSQTSGRPKSDAGMRTVPLPSKIVSVLAEHMQTYPADYVFTGGRGAQLHVSNFGERTFKQAVAKWNAVRETQALPPLKPRVHDLRHTAITHWIRLGADLPRVKTWAGHTNAAFTLDRYAGYFPQDDSKFMDALDQGIGAR